MTARVVERSKLYNRHDFTVHLVNADASQKISEDFLDGKWSGLTGPDARPPCEEHCFFKVDMPLGVDLVLQDCPPIGRVDLWIQYHCDRQYDFYYTERIAVIEDLGWEDLHLGTITIGQ